MNQEAFIQLIKKIDWLSDAGHLSEVLMTGYEWEWLPCSHSEQNPYPISTSKVNHETATALSTVAYKTALVSLRKVGHAKHPLLVISPHDYTQVFRGSALYCVRHAAQEIAVEQPGIWCEVLDFYIAGKWPCGVQENGGWVLL